MNCSFKSIVISFLTLTMSGILISAAAGQFAIEWYTVDSGGGISSSGAFELQGTIGQPDAGTIMTSGNFALVGGFWAASSQSSIILGDVNGDGVVNLLDVAPFIDAISSGDYIPEADVNEDGEVNLLDVGPFIDLLAG